MNVTAPVGIAVTLVTIGCWMFIHATVFRNHWSGALQTIGLVLVGLAYAIGLVHYF